MNPTTTAAIVHTTQIERMRAFAAAIGFTAASDDAREYASPFAHGFGLLLLEAARLPYASLDSWIFLEFYLDRDAFDRVVDALDVAGFEPDYCEHPRTREAQAVDPDGRIWHFLHYT